MLVAAVEWRQFGWGCQLVAVTVAVAVAVAAVDAIVAVTLAAAVGECQRQSRQRMGHQGRCVPGASVCERVRVRGWVRLSHQQRQLRHKVERGVMSHHQQPLS
jgi:hypothetical protein